MRQPPANAHNAPCRRVVVWSAATPRRRRGGAFGGRHHAYEQPPPLCGRVLTCKLGFWGWRSIHACAPAPSGAARLSALVIRRGSTLLCIALVGAPALQQSRQAVALLLARVKTISAGTFAWPNERTRTPVSCVAQAFQDSRSVSSGTSGGSCRACLPTRMLLKGANHCLGHLMLAHLHPAGVVRWSPTAYLEKRTILVWRIRTAGSRMSSWCTCSPLGVVRCHPLVDGQ